MPNVNFIPHPLVAVAASGEWLHWTGLGCLGLIAIFVGSIYKATTPCLIPGLQLGRPRPID